MSERVRSRERFELSISVFMLYLLKETDQVLFVLRKNTGWLDDHYCPPGGVKEAGETLEEGAVREGKEEVGITTRPEDVVLVHAMHNFTTGKEWLGFFFLATEWSGEPEIQEPEKHDHLLWCSINDLPENISPYALQALEAWQEKMPYSKFGWNIPADAAEEEYDYKHVKKKK